MMKIFVIFLIVIVGLGVLVGLVAMIRGKKLPKDSDSEYLDKDGNHVYYDRRIIRENERREE